LFTIWWRLRLYFYPSIQTNINIHFYTRYYTLLMTNTVLNIISSQLTAIYLEKSSLYINSKQLMQLVRINSIHDSNPSTRYVTVLRNQSPNGTYNHSQGSSFSRSLSITLQRRIQIHTAFTRSTINYNLKFNNGTDELVCKRIIQINHMSLCTAFIRDQPTRRRAGRVIKPNRNANIQIANLSMLK